MQNLRVQRPFVSCTRVFTISEGILTLLGYLSMIGFTTTMMANWEAEALSLSAGLLNGGNVALVYGYLLVFCGTLATAYSLGELASMWPTAGGQYHWVALLTPGKLKQFLSFLAGYVSILAWQATTASCAFLAATVVSGFVTRCNRRGWLTKKSDPRTAYPEL